MMTVVGEVLPNSMVRNYFEILVNKFFKILPIWEEGEETLPLYMRSLQSELIGCKEFIEAFKDDPDVLTLCSILQFFIDHPDSEVEYVKREVFRSISICNRLKRKYEGRCEYERMGRL